MAKGLAVISGSNTVVFKALENGVVKMGGVDSNLVLKPAIVTISGSLTVSGSGGIHMDIGGSEYKLENLSGVADKIVISGSTSEDGSLRGGLAWQGTSSMPEGANGDINSETYLSDLDGEHLLESPDDFVVVNADGQLRRANKIDASVVMLNNGQTIEQQVGAAKLRLAGTSVLGGVTGSEVSLTKGDLEFVDVANRTRVTVAQDDANNYSSSVTIDLDPNVRVETLSASMGLEVTGSSKLKGALHVVDSDATIDGKLTVKGNLDVLGDISQVTINQSNLSIEDAIILVGSGSDGTTGELGIIFGTEGTDADGNVYNKAFTLKDGDFYLGGTSDNAADSDIDSDNDGSGKLVLSHLSASTFVDALDLRVHDSATITGKLTAKADVDLGDHATDVIKIQGQLTASAPARFQANIDVENNAQVTFATGSNLTLDEGSVTLSKGDLTMTEGSATLAKGDIDVQDGSLKVNGFATLTASAGDDQLALGVKGRTELSSSAGSNALHVDSGNVLIDEALTVGGTVTLNDAAGALNVAGEWTEQPSLKVAGSLNVSGSVRLGEDVNDRVIVQGQFRIPKFTASDIPSDFITNAGDYEGYMFYLSGDGTAEFPNGNKWYFNEGGVWHSSFFWSDADELGADGL
jgi:hypothetical protein